MRTIINYSPGAVRYWIAINRHTCAVSGLPATVIPSTSPVAQMLIGFSTLKAAQEAQAHLLTDPVERCEESLFRWRDDVSITIVINEKADPPTEGGATIWCYETPKQKAANRRKKRRR